jgi:hypothetical protein
VVIVPSGLWFQVGSRRSSATPDPAPEQIDGFANFIDYYFLDSREGVRLFTTQIFSPASLAPPAAPAFVPFELLTNCAVPKVSAGVKDRRVPDTS